MGEPSKISTTRDCQLISFLTFLAHLKCGETGLWQSIPSKNLVTRPLIIIGYHVDEDSSVKRLSETDVSTRTQVVLIYTIYC